MIIDKLQKAGLIHPPKWLPNNTALLCIVGSAAYGVSSDNSDMDLYGIAIPPKEVIFPHLAGIIRGFGDQGPQFESWSEHHIKSPDSITEYDFTVFNIVKFFQLAMGVNPNIIDVLYVPVNCVVHSTHVGQLIRENRKLFLHKGAWNSFKGYSYDQLTKIREKKTHKNPKRAESIEKYGMEVKFAYHTVRLLNEVEQILVEGDLDLQRNSAQLKDIRRGAWTLEQLEDYFQNKEKALETIYANSTLRATPDEEKIKDLLMNCLEAHYGTISSAIQRVPSMDAMINDIEGLLAKYRASNT
jgi:uncharacterized protein